ncbi:MAG: ZIP family metal transporter [Ruminococcaceae bacterium]|nr:ZIP family metal transporter [Oscillospiraceae bacterium]
MNIAILWAFIATIGTWLLTALGAATVLFLKAPKQSVLNLMLGFSSGVMIAASFWSLLQPAIERAELTLKTPSYIVVTGGFIFGAIFIWLSDKAVSYAFKKANLDNINAHSKINRAIMLILSITLHNIPEGLAVGVAFGLLKQNYTSSALMGAISIAIGIGLQNFPEGAAVSLPLRREGCSRKKSFFYGQLSAIVEPIAGVVGAVLVSTIETILPFALSFAAGAMIIVAVHELIPECQQNKSDQPYTATMGIITGFAVMMLLDVMLG